MSWLLLQKDWNTTFPLSSKLQEVMRCFTSLISFFSYILRAGDQEILGARGEPGYTIAIAATIIAETGVSVT
ncbi:hypothetical protein Y1Q_0015190 [Alligator mississippiensis]|uniref:Uncharacterized protein n=1 Tax=Alligator mississippiensis TaxID=8496 RepID=A0A151P9G5_ALLMI|nr:hypothetical protein Y1Q_0015190 [Alligator mississippiensis]